MFYGNNILEPKMIAPKNKCLSLKSALYIKCLSQESDLYIMNVVALRAQASSVAIGQF